MCTHITVTHIRWDVLVFIINAQGHSDELLKGLLHPLSVANSIVAQDEVEARLDVGTLAHDVLEGRYGVRVLAHAHKHHADILHDLDPHFLVSVGDLIQSHAVELDGLRVVLLFEVDVGHVDFQTAWRNNTYSDKYYTVYSDLLGAIYETCVCLCVSDPEMFHASMMEMQTTDDV